MALLQTLLPDLNIHAVGFTGGKGRNHLLNQLAGELARNKNRIVITHLSGNILPSAGLIVYDDDQKALLRKIEKKLSEDFVVYAGTELVDHFLKGIHPQMVPELLQSEKIDYCFFIFGEQENASLLSMNEISEIRNASFIDQVLYCFQMDYLDRPLNSQITSNIEDFYKRFPQSKKSKILHHEVIVTYLLDERRGVFSLHKKNRELKLILTDIDSILLENHAINIARDLMAAGFQHIYQANLKENLVKRISTR